MQILNLKSCITLYLFFCSESFSMKNVFVDLVEIPDWKAQTIIDCVIQSLAEKHIPIENVIGFCADT